MAGDGAMKERCINLRDFQVRALQAGATALLLPWKGSDIVAWHGSPVGAEIAPGRFIGAASFLREFAPCAPGDVLIGREAWGVYHQDVNDAICTRFKVYRADEGIYRPWDNGHPRPWRSASTMPRWAARWRLPVVSCSMVAVAGLERDHAEALRTGGLPYYDFFDAYPAARWAWLVEVQRQETNS